jgi:hypothetical protein
LLLVEVVTVDGNQILDGVRVLQQHDAALQIADRGLQGRDGLIHVLTLIVGRNAVSGCE